MIINILEEDVFANANWSILKNIEFCKKDCEVLATGLHPITDDYLNTYPNVKYILSATTGVDHIKISNKDVRIISLNPSEVGDISASAEFAILLILSILKRIDIGLVSLNRKSMSIGEDIYGKTIGILGYGRIGQKIAKWAEAMDCNTIFHDIKDGSSKEEVLRQSDIVLLSMSCVSKNRHYMARNEFNMMKHGSYFINISRGFLVNEIDLIEAIENEIIKGAALDVIDNESLMRDYANRSNKIIITPHMAGYTIQSQKKACDFVIKKLSKEICNEKNSCSN
tara:strand:+ start:1569 stop:2414 length:846 start_codon:yes stop_codon:yes gene_type:complete